MTLPIKPSIKNVWATSGVKVEPSDAKVNAGWIVERPPHQFQNFLQNRSDQFLKHINEAGIPLWDAVTVYTAGKSYTQGSDGKIYKCLVDGFNENPVGNPTKWMLTFGDIDIIEYVEQAEDSAIASAASAVESAASATTALNTLAVFDDEPPASPFQGRHWTDSDTGKTYEWMIDADGGQWVEVGSPTVVAATAFAEYLGTPEGASLVGFERTAIASAIPVDLGEWIESTPLRDIECGVIGNGVADDTLTLNILTAAGRAAGCKVVGRVGATYKITDTVHINCNADFGGSTFSTTTALATVAVKTSGTVAGGLLRGLDIRYPSVITNKANGAIPTVGSIGIQIEGARNCRMEFHTVSGFEENLQLFSNDGTNGYVSYLNMYFNEVFVGSKINIHLKTDLTGWVNQCTWNGGQFAQYTADAAAYSATNVKITKVTNTGNNPPNGHTFIGCSMEGAFNRTIQYSLPAGFVTTYFSCNTWINCRFEASTNMEFNALALYDLFVGCHSAQGATYVGNIYPNILGGTRLFRQLTDVAAIPGAAGFRTATSVPFFQVNNTGTAAAIAFGINNRINSSVAANGDFAVYNNGNDTSLFPMAAMRVSGGTPRLEMGGGTVAATNYISWINTNDMRITSNFNPSADITYGLGTAALRYANVYANNFRPGAGTATWTSGAATPEGAVTATVGSIFTRTDGASGTTLYIKESGAGNTGWVSTQKDIVSFTDYMTVAERTDARSGAPALDHTTSMQAAIDANKGKKIIGPSGYVFNAAGLTLSGATYNGTEIVFEGEFLLKQRPLTSSATYQGAWVGILFKDVSNVSLTMRANGQRTVQPNEEHIYLVGLAGVQGMSIPYFKGREIRGDGLYISQSDWTTTSTNTDGLTIGTFEVSNSADDGRNGISLISADNVAIGTFRSMKVGGTVGAFTQPGGLDIEPNHSGQSCKNITVGSVNVVTAGTSGLAIQGIAGTTVTRGVNIGVSEVLNTSAPSVNDGLGNLTITHNHTLLVRDSQDISVKSHRGRFSNAYGDSVIVHESTDVNIDGSVSHVAEGARLGNEASSPNGLIRCVVNLHITDTCRYGFRTGKLTGCKISGSVGVPTTGYYSGSLFGVIALASTQLDSEYLVNVAASSNWTRSYRNDATTPATFTNTVIRDCDLSGTWGDFTRQVGDMQVFRYNVRGVTDRTSIPSVGTNLWLTGQAVTNSIAGAKGSYPGWVFDGAAWNPMAPIGNAIGTISTGTVLTTASTPTLLCNATGGAFTVTLPTAASTSGQIFNIKKTDSSANAVTIDPNGAETIDGASTLVLNTQWQSAQIQSNGTAWYLL